MTNLTKLRGDTRNINTTKAKNRVIATVTYCGRGVTENTQLLLNFTVVLPRQWLDVTKVVVCRGNTFRRYY